MRGAVTGGDLIDGLNDIRIPPFDQAKRVFDARMLPRAVAATWAALPTDALEALGGPDGGVSALVSLTFSRGGPTWARLGGDRYREMRAIRAALAEGGRLTDVPYQIRAMKRLDQGAAQAGGLARRRDDEAKLLRDALAMPVAEMATVHPQSMLVEGVAEEVDDPPEDGPVGFDLSPPDDPPPRIALDVGLAEDGILAPPRLAADKGAQMVLDQTAHPDLSHLPAIWSASPLP